MGVARPTAAPAQQVAEANPSEEKLRLLLLKLFERFNGTVPRLAGYGCVRATRKP